jgi:branched-chain amino acid transport system permease protein
VVAAPATRLEGFYLALATLAFSQLVRVMIDEGGALTGGTGGLANYRLPPVLGMDLRGPWYTICLVLLVAATLWILQRVDGSWFGRACRAVRDNPRAAEAMGVHLARTKILVFVLTSTLAGIAGIGYAYVDNVINPAVFGLDNTFLLLFMIIIGGSGRHAGAMLGAVVLYLSPFALEPLVGNHYMLVFGLLIVLSILFRPDGLIGLLSPSKPGRAI